MHFYKTFFITLLVIFLFHIKKFVILKFYPPICNLIFFIIFFVSLFTKETIIQKIAKSMEGELNENTKIYTRKLTYVWCLFTFLNFIISVWTIFQNDKIWMIYNGIISYLLMGMIFFLEFILRQSLKRKGYL